MDRWVGKVAVVTGASFGIGEAIFKSLAKHDMVVIGLARTEDKLKKIADSINKNAYALKCDMRNEQDIISCFKKIEQQFGGVDVLINNAACLDMNASIVGDTESWKNIIETNLLGVCIASREALKTMRNRGDNGHIIHMNSVLGHDFNLVLGVKIVGLYPTTKFSITALSETQRIELRNNGSRIKITSISPGLTYTKLAADGVSKIFETDLKFDKKSDIPPGFLNAQDIADSIVLVLSLNPGVEVKELTIQSDALFN